MGVVYRARHLALDRERALKVISPALSEDPHFRERFQREARLAASLEHPNVVPVDHAGDEGGVLYLSMRLVEGSDLRRIVEAEGPLDARRASQLLAGVAAGLDAAHERGLLHRDVKPANVLVEGVNGDERVFLTDFGISRIAGGGGTVTASGELLGSPDYVAPEQVAGDRVDYRTDVYALGCLLHFALTGQPPFPRDNDLAKLFAHANAPRPRPSELVPGLPAALDGVVARAMAIRPEYRYESAGRARRGRGEHRPRRGARGGGRTAASAPRLRGGADSSPAATSWPPHGGDRRRLRRPGAGGRRRGAAPQRGRTAVVQSASLDGPLAGGHGAGRPRADRPRGLPRPPLGGRERRLRALRDRSGHQSAVATAGAGGRRSGLGRGRLRLDLGPEPGLEHAPAPGALEQERPDRDPGRHQSLGRGLRQALGLGREPGRRHGLANRPGHQSGRRHRRRRLRSQRRSRREPGPSG